MKLLIPSPLLRTALGLDAVVTGAVALLQVGAARPLADWLELPQPLVLGTGVFLATYTALLVVMLRSARLPVALVALVVAGNTAWALGCGALLASGAVQPTALGVAYVVVQALAVLAFAALQAAGWRRSHQSKPPRTAAA